MALGLCAEIRMLDRYSRFFQFRVHARQDVLAVGRGWIVQLRVDVVILAMMDDLLIGP